MYVRNVTGTTARTAFSLRMVPREGILIHTTGGYNSLGWLQRDEPNPDKRSSADWLIDRAGNAFLIVPLNCYSYHSGKARYKGRQDIDGTLNRSFVGVELECADQLGEKITDLQYISLASLVRTLLLKYPISCNMIALHKEAALPPGRKVDPVFFDWPIFTREMIAPSPNAPDYRVVVQHA